VLDTRGNASLSTKERLHSDILIDFVLTKDENYVLTGSIDRTINLYKQVNL
jgi:hypothetical protein